MIVTLTMWLLLLRTPQGVWHSFGSYQTEADCEYMRSDQRALGEWEAQVPIPHATATPGDLFTICRPITVKVPVS